MAKTKHKSVWKAQKNDGKFVQPQPNNNALYTEIVIIILTGFLGGILGALVIASLFNSATY